jgi:hypothetical protein
MKLLDFLELPRTPRFLRFKGKTNFCFPIWDLPNKDIHTLFRRMAAKVIEEKTAVQSDAERLRHIE